MRDKVTDTRLELQDLKFINRINAAANAGSSLPEIYHLVSQGVRELYRCTGANIYVLDEDGTTLRLVSIGVSGSIIDKLEKLTGSALPEISISLQTSTYYRNLIETKSAALFGDRDSIIGLMAECTDCKSSA